MLNMYEHVRSAELLEPLENYTQNGNCPARFRERKQKMIEKKTPTFSARQLSLMWLKPSPILYGRSDETSAWLFSGPHLDVKHFGI